MLFLRFLLLALVALPLSAQEDLITWNPRIPKKNQQVTPPPELPPPPKKKKEKKSLPKSRIQIGGSYTYAHISSNCSFHGHLGGMQGLYEYRPMDFFYGGAEFIWKQGITKGKDGSRFLFMIDTQQRLGFTWGWMRKMRFFSLFSGFGYRHYGYDIRFSGSTARGKYNHLYIPIGFLFQGRVNSITDLGLNFQWMPQIYPTLTISPLKGARWILNKKIANFRGALPITVCVSRKYHVTFHVNPFFEYWQDGSTNARTQLGTSLRIPGNNYLFPGIDINWGYAF